MSGIADGRKELPMPNRLLSGLFTIGMATGLISSPPTPLEQRPRSPKPAVISFHCDVARPGTCVVRNAPGGNVLAHMRAAKVLLAQRKEMEIDGLCASACTITADIMSRNGKVCVTPKAVMMFHYPRFEVVLNGKPSMMKLGYTYEPGVQKWINSKGGLPWEGWLTMKGEEATSRFPTCPDQLSPAPGASL